MKRFLDYITEEKHADARMTKKQSEKLFDKLNAAIESIKQKYAKCMAVINLLDSNGGNLSEKILAYYLSQVKGITAERVGGDQELTDIKVTIDGQTLNVSLKTYNSANNIDLGSHLKLVGAGSVAGVAQKLNSNLKDYDVVHFTSKRNIKRKAIVLADIKDKSIANEIKNRIAAIVDKLCGEETNPELFCYIEKVYDKKQLKTFRFNIYEFNRAKLLKLLNSSYVTLTDGAYGLMIQKNNDAYVDIVIAQAKNQLTISPAFLRDEELMQSLINEKNRRTTSLEYGDNKIDSTKLIDPLYANDGKQIDDAYIKSLEDLYTTLTTAKKQ